MGMKFEKWLNQIDKFTRLFSRHLEWVGVIGIILMFLANFIDVVGAKFFLWPVPGATEVISFSQILAIAPAITNAIYDAVGLRVHTLPAQEYLSKFKKVRKAK